MVQNLNLTHGGLASEAVLLALTDAGWTRETAYAHVQQAAKTALDKNSSLLTELLRDDELCTAVGRDRLLQLVRVEPRYDMADEILRRLGILEE